MSLLFIHVPHTCGRLLNRILQSKIDSYYRIHNELDYTTKSFENMYIILREPVERCIAEYTHYSNRYHSQNIKVNNMTIEDDSYGSIVKYYSNECTTNIACKMILQKPFNCKITDEDYENILKKKFIYDIYSENITLSNLDNIYNNISDELNNPQYGRYIRTRDYQILTEEEKYFIRKRNEYDIKLFKQCTA